MSDKNSTDSSKIETYGLFFKAPIEYQTGKFGYVFRKDGVYVFHLNEPLISSLKTVYINCPIPSITHPSIHTTH